MLPLHLVLELRFLLLKSLLDVVVVCFDFLLLVLSVLGEHSLCLSGLEAHMRDQVLQLVFNRASGHGARSAFVKPVLLVQHLQVTQACLALTHTAWTAHDVGLL